MKEQIKKDIITLAVTHSTESNFMDRVSFFIRKVLQSLQPVLDGDSQFLSRVLHHLTGLVLVAIAHDNKEFCAILQKAKQEEAYFILNYKGERREQEEVWFYTLHSLLEDEFNLYLQQKSTLFQPSLALEFVVHFRSGLEEEKIFEHQFLNSPREVYRTITG